MSVQSETLSFEFPLKEMIKLRTGEIGILYIVHLVFPMKACRNFLVDNSSDCF